MRSVVAVAVLVLVACSDDATTDQPLGALDGPVMRYPERTDDDEGMAAEVRGVLVLEGECLYIRLDEVGERYPVLWPAGTRWDDERRAVVPPVGAVMPIGGEVYGGGGYLTVENVDRLAGSEASQRASDCMDTQHGEIAVVNNAPAAIAAVEK